MINSNQYLLNPSLLSYTKLIGNERNFVLESNSESSPIIIKDSRILKLLNSLKGKTFDDSHFFNAAEPYSIPRELVEDIFKNLIESKTIITKNELNKFELWDKYDWSEAFVYHNYTRNYPFLDMGDAELRKQDHIQMEEFANKSMPPSVYMNFKYIARIPLINCKDIIENGNVESELEKLSLIFHLAFGERRKLDFSFQGKFLSKSIPSGGARHPLEIFIVSFDFNCVNNGIYHYNVENNSLDCLEKGEFYNYFKTATFDLFDKYENENPKALLIFLSKVDRAMWRYRESRSWRAILIDTGHALMAYRKISDSVGFKFYTFQKTMDHMIYSKLGVNKFDFNLHFVGTLV